MRYLFWHMVVSFGFFNLKSASGTQLRFVPSTALIGIEWIDFICNQPDEQILNWKLWAKISFFGYLISLVTRFFDFNLVLTVAQHTCAPLLLDSQFSVIYPLKISRNLVRFQPQENLVHFISPYLKHFLEQLMFGTSNYGTVARSLVQLFTSIPPKMACCAEVTKSWHRAFMVKVKCDWTKISPTNSYKAINFHPWVLKFKTLEIARTNDLFIYKRNQYICSHL